MLEAGAVQPLVELIGGVLEVLVDLVLDPTLVINRAAALVLAGDRILDVSNSSMWSALPCRKWARRLSTSTISQSRLPVAWISGVTYGESSMTMRIYVRQRQRLLGDMLSRELRLLGDSLQDRESALGAGA